MPADDANPATMEPREFALLVKNTPTSELRRMMRGEKRTAVLDELFARMPSVFRAERARGLEAVVHWNVGDRPDGGTDVYELVISGGRCAISARPDREPGLTLTLGAVDFLQLVTGNAHALALVMRGKMRTKGDLALTAKFPSLFDIPRAGRPAAGSA
ncbi:hypothetical protein GCM10022251_11220 [Phytohabitans flavus]|uniref:SCP2 domain-containing protein n=1 Tax=Phytohabitans flavus TaxID=1076124 RepID=A0A6F8XJU1_9ACTN|nr:SCP2 sterol-binding domain-containing protein [Phytohabitans flavus]BCB74073.1 hypothetical protein Pflav_004830 [Phytohabitans flavus]